MPTLSAAIAFYPGRAHGRVSAVSLHAQSTPSAPAHHRINRAGVARETPLPRLRLTKAEGLRGRRAYAGASGDRSQEVVWAMWFAVKRLTLGIVLIAAGSAVLLLTDVRPTAADGRSRPRIAILQQASTPVLDEGVRGMVDGLAEKGYRDGHTADITTYNAHGDLPTANAIAREITDGRFELVLTSSTPSLQVVANANKAGRAKHVFGIVADPFVADVGLDRANPLKHPPYLVGQSIMLPVGDAFRVAKRMWPGLTKIGVAWNPAEPNSRMFVGKAKEAAPDLGIELIEAQVENTSGVTEAIHSVLGRGAQVIWVGGDNTICSAIDSVVATARQARAPVFSILPGNPDRGTIFDLGLDF